VVWTEVGLVDALVGLPGFRVIELTESRRVDSADRENADDEGCGGCGIWRWPPGGGTSRCRIRRASGARLIALRVRLVPMTARAEARPCIAHRWV